MKTQNEILENVYNIGRIKATLPAGRAAVLSMMAGAFISLGGMLSLMSSAGFASNPSLMKLCSGYTFPIGLLLTVFFGAELFTGNCALLIPSYRRREVTTAMVMRSWGMSWTGNFIGSLLFVVVFVAGCGVLDSDPFRSVLVNMAETKSTLPLLTAFCRGILANWLVCLAIWLALSVNGLTGKVLACYIPVAAFVIMGGEHSVANMFFVPAGMVLGANVDIIDFLVRLIVVTAGNIVGGALLLGFLTHSLYRKN